LRWRQAFFAVCAEYDIQPAHACIQFGMQAPGVHSIALNTTRPAKVKENIDMAAVSVPDDFWHALKERQLI